MNLVSKVIQLFSSEPYSSDTMVLSYSWIISMKLPIILEKKTIPINIKQIPRSISLIETGYKSPYPTVERVVNAK